LANEKNVRTLVGYTVDKQSENQVIASSERIKQSLNQTVQAVKDLPATGGSVAIQRLTNDFEAFDERIKIAQGDVNNLKDDIAGIEFPTFTDADFKVPSVGGGGGGGQGLGSQIRSLPSIQIPGLGIGTDAIGNLVRVIERIPPSALPAVAAVAALGVAVKVISDRVPDVTAGIRQITELDKKYYEARVSGTKDSINAIIEEKQLEQKVAQARLDDLKFVTQGYDELHNKVGSTFDGLIEVAGALNAANFKDIREARLAYDQANEELKKANKELGLYNGLLDDNSVAVNTAAEAQKKAIEDGRQRIISSVENEATLNAEILSLQKDGSEKELEEKRKAAKAAADLAIDEVNRIQVAIDAGNARGEDTTELVAKQSQYFDAFSKASDEALALSDKNLQAQVKLNDAEKEAIKIREDEANATRKFIDDVKKLNEDKNQSEIDLWTKLTDKQVEIADKAADDVQKALEGLTAKEAALKQNLDRALEDQEQKSQFDAIQRQVKYYRQEEIEE